MKASPQLNNEVALLLGLPAKEVRAVTSTFVTLIRQALLDEEEVRIDQLGTLHLKAARGKKKDTMVQGTFKKGVGERRMTVHAKQKFFVYFRKSLIMKRELIERHGKAPTT